MIPQNLMKPGAKPKLKVTPVVEQGTSHADSATTVSNPHPDTVIKPEPAFKIETGIPVPREHVRQQKGGLINQIMATMKEGDSVVLNKTQANNLTTQMRKHSIHCCCRKIIPDKYRIWHLGKKGKYNYET
jgi:hypothetical protein